MRDSAVHGGGGINNSGRRSTTQGITTEKLYQEKRKEVYRELKEFSEQATHPCMHCEQKEKCCEAWRKADEHPDDLLICERFCDWLRDRERIYGKLDVIQYIEAEGRVKNGGGGRGEL